MKRVIYFFLDGTIAEPRKRDIDTHLGDCPDCERRANVQRKLREFVHHRLARITAPDHLRTRLTRSIRAFRTEWSR
ncbi:MAG: zf-HC2 domain-containing protein [Acidobacteria bacterium]|nr:zf-HC2 domain-containing protein [Acidobacteriota bacterium]